jgi:hypothetical protein
MAGLSGAALALAPDNLDGQYISPRTFREHLSASYRHTSEILHGARQRLVVHAGGPVSRLLPLLAECGVDVVAGVSGPPQGDSPLDAARAAAGPNLILWGGIPQDLLLDAHSAEEFESALQAAVALARADGRVLLGIADAVPVEANLARLSALHGLL